MSESSSYVTNITLTAAAKGLNTIFHIVCIVCTYSKTANFLYCIYATGTACRDSLVVVPTT